MAIETQGNVPLNYQRFDGTYWYAAARMLYRWSMAARGTANGMADPAVHAETKDMEANNRAFPYDNVAKLKEWLGTAEASVTWDFNGVSLALKRYGPLWLAGYKGYYHVVVCCGVADTGVLVHDPEPVGRGTREWWTWTKVKSFMTAKGDINIPVMACP